LIFEFVATFLFVTVILGATAQGGGGALAGLVIGLTLVLIHLAGINISGASVNPARSLAPALFVGGAALQQIWLYIAAPLAGGLLAGVLHRSGLVSAPV
jgi:aquaporin Z